jgi:hypothetical protein
MKKNYSNKQCVHFKKFEQITKPSHHMFDSNTCSLALMLEVKPIVDGELEILYKHL